MKRYSLGIDYGTNSVRAVVVETDTGRETAAAVWPYPQGERGVLLQAGDPDLARQHPSDYREGLKAVIRAALEGAGSDGDFSREAVAGIGVDTTGSTPLPLDADGQPLTDQPRFAGNLHAMAWLWKDHTAHAEAAEIAALARERRPAYLRQTGGAYSSEWFWAKLLRAARVAPDVFEAAHTWAEVSDWIPALLTGSVSPARMKRNICAAGHKALFHPAWGGYPDAGFLGALDPRLAALRATLPGEALPVGRPVGGLSAEWAAHTGLPAGVPVSAGAFDAHLGAVGAGIRPGTLVKIMGTSTCDILVSPLAGEAPDIPGLCGIVPESVLPGHFGFEAGQSAVGDIFHWFVERVRPAGFDHDTLTAEAESLRPGQSGLLGLDWHNGNRTILVDPRLTGLILGLTLSTTPAEIYRALVESTAFGARRILDRFEEYGVAVGRIVCCGGISARNRMVMQLYADITGRPMEISSSAQTCALGAAVAGAVAGGSHASFEEALARMTSTLPGRFEPDPAARSVYERLYALYVSLHDLFGTRAGDGRAYEAMKTLLALRDEARS